MTCREVTQFLIDYVCGELPGEQREIFEKHVAACAPCQAYLHGYRKTILLTKRAFAAAESEPLPESLVQAVLAATREPSRR